MDGIRIVTEPSVFLVGRQQVDEDAMDAFLESEGVDLWSTDTDVAGQKLAEVAGRCCYMSFARPRPGGNGGYLAHILESGHGSVLESAVFNFVITGVSRSFTHELIRHRAGFGYSQLSQRFVDESTASYVVPPAMIEEVAAARSYIDRVTGRPGSPASGVSMDMTNMRRPAAEEQAGLDWLVAVESAQESYRRLSDYLTRKAKSSDLEPTDRRKAAREAARSVLPNATETKIFVTANVRALRHFVEMRGSAGADAEIRRVALAILAILKAEAPNLFGDYAVAPIGGVDCVSTPYPKV